MKNNTHPKKKCLFCHKNNVTGLWGEEFRHKKPWYDEESNSCEECFRISRKLIPVSGEWGRHAESEKRAFAKDVLQPLNKDGTINKHFVQAHGTRTLEKEFKATPQAIRAEAEKYG
jgi:hypothetical protein